MMKAFCSSSLVQLCQKKWCHSDRVCVHTGRGMLTQKYNSGSNKCDSLSFHYTFTKVEWMSLCWTAVTRNLLKLRYRPLSHHVLVSSYRRHQMFEKLYSKVYYSIFEKKKLNVIHHHENWGVHFTTDTSSYVWAVVFCLWKRAGCNLLVNTVKGYNLLYKVSFVYRLLLWNQTGADRNILSQWWQAVSG